MKRIKTLNEIVLQVLQINKWISGDAIINYIYHNSIGGLRITPVELREIIKNLRFGGHPIIANKKGYKYTANQVELANYIDARKLELESELIIIKAMEKTLW